MLLVFVMVLGGTQSAFADSPTAVGTSEFPFDGPKENTFAQEMDLHQIYLVGEKFNPMDYKAIDPDSMNRSPALDPLKEKVSPEPVCYGGNLVQTNDTRLDGHPMAVYLRASAMPATTGRIGSKDYGKNNYIEYTYEDSAIFPDGSSGDVTIRYTLLHIDAYQDVDGNDVEYGEPITITMFGTRLHANFGTLAGYSSASPDAKFRSFKAYIKTEIIVTGAKAGQTFILPVHGVSAIKDTEGSHRGMREGFPDRTPDGAIKSVREHVKLDKSVKVYYSDQGSFDLSEGGNYFFPENGATDPDYTGGIVFEGKSGVALEFGAVAGRNASDTYANDLWLTCMGDLQHRITSGSGSGGKIATDKKGNTKGTELEGGDFTGDIGDIDPASKDLRRYVVPDAKTAVTYTMTPKTGYRLEKLVVDGNEFSRPKDEPTVGQTWTLKYNDYEGALNYDGTVSYLGEGKYSFSFDQANDNDHTIYVTWERLNPPTGQDATSKNEKGVTQTGKPKFTQGTGDIPATDAYKLLDKDGKPTTTLTVAGEGKYTINPDTGVVTFVPEPGFVGTAKGVTVQVTDQYGLTATAKYTPTVVDNEKTKEISRTIKYTYLTKDGETAHKDVVQKLRAVEHGHYDPTNPNADENGMVWDNKWTYPDGKTFPAVENPSINGWKTNDIAGEYTITGPNDKPSDVHIVYQKVEKPSWVDGSAVETSNLVGKTQTGTLTFKLGDSPLSSVHLIDPNTGEELPEGVTEVEVYQNGKKVGTYKLNPNYTINPDGTISFDIDFIPEGGYVGTPPPLTVRIYDENGDCADGIYQPKVRGAYEQSSKKGANTGDQTNVIIWISVLLAVAAVMSAIIIRRRRR